MVPNRPNLIGKLTKGVDHGDESSEHLLSAFSVRQWEEKECDSPLTKLSLCRRFCIYICLGRAMMQYILESSSYLDELLVFWGDFISTENIHLQ